MIHHAFLPQSGLSVVILDFTTHSVKMSNTNRYNKWQLNAKTWEIGVPV